MSIIKKGDICFGFTSILSLRSACVLMFWVSSSEMRAPSLAEIELDLLGVVDLILVDFEDIAEIREFELGFQVEIEEVFGLSGFRRRFPGHPP